jgi:hypothetical protein
MRLRNLTTAERFAAVSEHELVMASAEGVLRKVVKSVSIHEPYPELCLRHLERLEHLQHLDHHRSVELVDRRSRGSHRPDQQRYPRLSAAMSLDGDETGPLECGQATMAGAAADAESRQHLARQCDGAAPRDPSEKSQHDRHVQRLAGLPPCQREPRKGDGSLQEFRPDLVTEGVLLAR